jgi:protein SCO1/2
MLEVKNSYLKLTLLVILLFISMILGMYVYQHSHTKMNKHLNLIHATYIQPGRVLAPFQLQKTDGQTLSPSNLAGHWTILFFGYTQCRSICPTTMDMLHKVFVQLRKDKIQPLPEMIMISLDGQRDSLETMRRYVKGFDAEFKGAIGPIETIQQLTQELGVVYDDSQLSRPDGQIDHSGSLTLVNPVGEVVAFFIPPMQAKDVAKDLETLINTFQMN